MNRPTLSQFRAQFPTEALGVCASDPQVAVYCNDAQERLLMDPLAPENGWWGSWARYNFTAVLTNSVAYITTPREVARITDMAVCQAPVRIRNGFFEFLQFSAGVQPKTCQATGCGSTLQAFERDNVVTLSQLSGTKTIRIYPTDARDSGLRVLVQGKDANAQVILTTDPGTGLSAPGEYISLAFPFADSTNLFSSISGIEKDETYGPIQIFQVDPTLGTEAALSSMEPTEGTASYRRYLVNGIPSSNLCCQGSGTAQVTTTVRLDFTPVANETDYLSLPCVPALVEESLSIRYSKMDSANAAQQSILHHNRAIQLLNGQLDLYTGKTNVAVQVPIWGSNKMRASFR